MSLIFTYLLSALSQELSLPPRTRVSKVPVRAGSAQALCVPCLGLPWPDEANLRPTHPGSSLWTQLIRQLGSSGYIQMNP